MMRYCHSGHAQLDERPYQYIQTGSIRRFLDEWHNEILNDTRVLQILGNSDRTKCSIRTDLKTRVTSKGRLRVKQYYWTLQAHNENRHNPFIARTFTVLPDLSVKWFEFPDDPVLGAATTLMGKAPIPKVLQYVPLRRLTMLETCAAGNTSVLKLKRRNRTIDAQRRLQAINECFSGHDSGFMLAQDLGVCRTTGGHRQSLLPGVRLSETVCKDNALALISRLGGKLARFHRNLESQLPESTVGFYSELEHQVLWVCAALPEAVDSVTDLYNWLINNRQIQTNTSICHGDLSLDQILVDDNRWSLIDMDHAHLGDPIRDLARLLVVLSTELADLQIPTVRLLHALCDGYGFSKVKMDTMQALRWHCCRCEIEQLSIMLRKDLGTSIDRLACLDRARMYMLGNYNVLA